MRCEEKCLKYYLPVTTSLLGTQLVACNIYLHKGMSYCMRIDIPVRKLIDVKELFTKGYYLYLLYIKLNILRLFSARYIMHCNYFVIAGSIICHTNTESFATPEEHF